VNAQHLKKEGASVFATHTAFLVQNLHFFYQKTIQEDLRKKLLNASATGQKNLVY
jgi:hypothetical protein